ncbi:MAG: LamG domain-containing protein, partial [Verrucomicrobiota bacterium]
MELTGSETGLVMYYDMNDGFFSTTAADLGPSVVTMDLFNIGPEDPWIRDNPIGGGLVLVNDYNGTADASDVYGVGVHTVIWTATDDAGLMGVCTQIVQVVDAEPPMLFCAPDMTVNNDPGFCDALVTVPTPTYSDNCDAFEYAVEFDGTDDVIVATNSAPVDNLGVGPFTMEVWVQPFNPASGTPQNLIRNFSDYVLGIDGSGRPYLRLWPAADSTINLTNYVATSSLTPGAWQHIAVTWDGADVQFYIDGSPVTDVAVADTEPIVPADLLFGNNLLESNPFSGRMDEVRIWSLTLDQASIASRMNQRLTGDELGLLGYWDFNEGMGTVLLDQSANSSHGDLRNFDIQVA